MEYSSISLVKTTGVTNPPKLPAATAMPLASPRLLSKYRPKMIKLGVWIADEPMAKMKQKPIKDKHMH